MTDEDEDKDWTKSRFVTLFDRIWTVFWLTVSVILAIGLAFALIVGGLELLSR
ncbi:MAG: hypothetical protein ACRDJS_02890 [Actinomycetota bacterium]